MTIISKIKNTVSWTYVISDLNGEEIAGRFYKKQLQKTNQKEFRIEKVIKRKTDIDHLEIDKLAPISVNLSNLSDAVKNDIVKKAVYDKPAVKVNNTDTIHFVFKTKHQTYKAELEKKITDITEFVKKMKLPELENKIPDVSS